MYQKQKSEIKKELNKLTDEKVFRELLYSLLCKMNFERVKITHGPNEAGKDLVCSFLNPFKKREWVGFVAKIGNITGGTKAAESSVLNVKNQVELSFSQPYFDSIDKKENFLNKVYVATNGNISGPAQAQILISLKEKANIEFWDNAVLVDLVYEYIPEYFVNIDLFVYEYYNLITKEYEKLNELKSFQYKKELKNLLEVYIDPTLVIKKKDIDAKSTSLKNPVKYEFIKASKIKEINHNIFIVGESGSGKSTLIRKLALEIIETSKTNEEYKKLPIVIRFKEIIEKGGVLEAIEFCLKNHNINELEINLDNRLKNKEVILFVDALDEIANESDIKTVLHLLNEFSTKYGIKIVATSRNITSLSDDGNIATFKKMDLLKLDFRQINNFLGKWFSKDEVKKNKLLKSLQDTEILNKLPKTPLVLTIIAILFDENEQEIPSNLTELYSMFTELLLGRWDSERNIESMFKYEIKDRILRLIASQLQSSKSEEIDEMSFVQFINEYGRRRSLELEPKELIKEIEKRSQLIYRNPRGNFQFKHLSFQEYFTAKDLFERRVSQDFVIENYLDPWWQEVIFFYCGRLKECPELLHQIIELVKVSEIKHILVKITSLGHILQAAYTTEVKDKVEAIDHALNLQVSLLGEISESLSKKLPFLKGAPRIMILDFLSYLFNLYYSSVTIKGAAEKLFKQILDNVDPTDEKFISIDIYKLFFLACLLNELGDPEKLLELSKVVTASDMSLVYLIKLRIESVTSIDKDDIYKKSLRKINNKVSRWKKELIKELNSPIKSDIKNK